MPVSYVTLTSVCETGRPATVPIFQLKNLLLRRVILLNQVHSPRLLVDALNKESSFLFLVSYVLTMRCYFIQPEGYIYILDIRYNTYYIRYYIDLYWIPG